MNHIHDFVGMDFDVLEDQSHRVVKLHVFQKGVPCACALHRRVKVRKPWQEVSDIEKLDEQNIQGLHFIDRWLPTKVLLNPNARLRMWKFPPCPLSHQCIGIVNDGRGWGGCC